MTVQATRLCQSSRNLPQLRRLLSVFTKNLKRIGIVKNFETAISLCQGDIICLADQDDVWLPKKIAALANAFSIAARH